MKLVVHMIGNAHLDPAWLWTWQAGVDESLNTCRTACDLLDLYPDFHVTRGEAWVHEQIQRLDPELFARIAAHVAGGRWNIVNGWWIQPDCNLPGAESFRKQAEYAGRYFQEQLGFKCTVGYNVDSFGHCAMLPSFLREAGMDAYVFMRPGPHEMELPAHLFRWRSPDGAEVTAFRISRSYSASSVADLAPNIDAAIQDANREVGHTMVFYGVGDHGGGPTRSLIEWIQGHRQYADDVELRLSHPCAFFDAVTPHIPSLPVVDGELQLHAVGCYSAVQDIKRLLRQGEAMLLQAERMAAQHGETPEIRQRLDLAWKSVLFNQFHDIMGGTCIETACKQTFEELGLAKSLAREVLVELTRKAMVALPPLKWQRLVLANPSDRPWRGLADFEPSLPEDGAPYVYHLVDESGREVPLQMMNSEAAMGKCGRALFPVEIPANGRQILQLHRANPAAYPAQVQVDGQTVSNDAVSATGNATGIAAFRLAGQDVLGSQGIRIDVFDDPTDTWSHGTRGYEGEPRGTFTATTPWTVEENGPLRAAISNHLRCENASLTCTASVEAGTPALRLRLRLHWMGQRQLVKLIIPPGFTVAQRWDGTPGTLLARPLNGQEFPVRDVVILEGEGTGLAAMSPDIASADVQPDGAIRLTLLRSPIYAHHDPFVLPEHHSYPVTDQGVHEYEIVLWAGASHTDEAVLDEVERLSNPLWISETTKGMPSGWRYDMPLQEGQFPLSVAPVDAVLPDALLAGAEGAATIMDGGEVSTLWQGDPVLVTGQPDLRLKVNLPVDGPYRLAVAHAEGGVWGKIAVRCQGQDVGTLGVATPASGGMVSLLPNVLQGKSGEAVLELHREGGERLGLGFVQFIPVFRDIPADRWMVAGPYQFGRTDAQSQFSAIEAALQSPFAPETEPSVTWQPAVGDGDVVDFQRVTGKTVGHIHYAVTHIHAPRTMRVRLSYGIDYFARLYLNGEVIVPYRPGDGGVRKGQFTVDVTLHAGDNQLLVKLASGSGGARFWMAISDLPELRFTAE